MALIGRMSSGGTLSTSLIGRMGVSNTLTTGIPPTKAPQVFQTVGGKPSFTLPKVSSAGQTISQAPEKKWPFGFVGEMAKAAFDNVKATMDDATNKLVDMVNTLGNEYNLKDYNKLANREPGETVEQVALRKGIKKVTPLQRSVGMGRGAVGSAGLAFLPVTTQLEAAKQLPGPLAIPAKIASGIFEDLGRLGSYTLGNAVDLLPVSKETKDEIKPLAEELGAFLAQVVGIKVAHKTATKGLNLKRLPLKEGIKVKISNIAQFATGISVTPFSTVYGLASSRIAYKVAKMKEKGIEVTPEVGRDIMAEVKQEIINNPPPDSILRTDKPEFVFEKPVEIPKAPVTEPLAIEARKYKGAEEFGKVQGEKVSGVAKSIEAKAIEERMVKGVKDLTEYDARNFKAEAKKVADLINKDVDRARAIVRGEEATDIRAGAIIAGMEAYAKAHPSKAGDIIQELANSPLAATISVGASETSFARMREKESAAYQLGEVKKTYESKVKNLPEKKTKHEKDLKTETDKFNLTKEELSFNRFLDKIIC